MLHGSSTLRMAGLLLAQTVLACPAARAQGFPTLDSTRIRSMGLPRALKPYGGIAFGFDGEAGDGQGVGRATFGIYRDLLNPAVGAGGLAAEGYGGVTGTEFDGGVRVFLASPALRLQLGVNYSVTGEHAEFALAVADPIRRGGLLGHGSALRIVWAPVRQAVEAGLTFPLFQPFAGRTRFKRLEVSALPAAGRSEIPPLPDDVVLRATLANLRESALWISHMTTLALPRGAPSFALVEDSAIAARIVLGDSAHPPGHTPAHEEADFHRALEMAFGSATTADAARRILLDDVLLPFNRDFARTRERDVLNALRVRAERSFADWVATSIPEHLTEPDVARGVFAALLDAVQEVADSAELRWGDSRLVWLPFQYALRPEEHDDQSEVDSLVGRVIGTDFQPGHDLVYATDERFQSALLQSIQETREYHVLWIHDFAGKAENGRPDSLSMRTVLQGYLSALASAAQLYDSLHSIPTFLLFLDQYYYQRSDAGLWLSLLQDPLGSEIRTKDHDVALRVRSAQLALQGAVAGSRDLRAAKQRYGESWLRRLISVHISVTNPSDPSFRSRIIVGGLTMALPDDLMRDHRKIAFADITESAPERGIALLTGLGVGEHYARFQWLDRTIVIRGAAALTLKSAARELLLSQGFRPEEIPTVLRPLPLSPDYSQRVKALESQGWFARVAIALNETGYGAKHSSAAKASLYTLMPAGSTIIVSDPQWLSRFWGGMLLGAALRGCHVLVVGPGIHNTAFEGSPIQASLQRDLFIRLLQAREILQGGLQASHGLLEVGLFSVGLGTHNVAGGVRAVRDGLRRYPFILESLPFSPDVVKMFDRADSMLTALGSNAAPDTAGWYHPRFHLKTQFMGTGSAMREILGRPEYVAFFARRIRERLKESPAGTDITLDHLSMLRPYLDARSPADRERQAMYLTVGSHNQDQRSLLLDGEATCIVSGAGSLVAAGDMLLLTTAGVIWLKSPEEARVMLPLPSKRNRGIAWLTEGLF